MAILFNDIVLDDNAFTTASQEMNQLKTDAETLKAKLGKMYDDVSGAMDTAAGDEVKIAAREVLLQPVEDLSAVIKHISETLDTIIGTDYYKDIFVKYEELNG